MLSRRCLPIPIVAFIFFCPALSRAAEPFRFPEASHGKTSRYLVALQWIRPSEMVLRKALTKFGVESPRLRSPGVYSRLLSIPIGSAGAKGAIDG